MESRIRGAWKVLPQVAGERAGERHSRVGTGRRRGVPVETCNVDMFVMGCL